MTKKYSAEVLKRHIRAGLPAALACIVGWQTPSSAVAEPVWALRGGFTDVAPSRSSGELSAPSVPDARFNVLPNAQMTLGLNRHWNEHWALDVSLSPAHRHDIEGAAALAAEGTLGSLRAQPLSLLAQYRFSPRWEVFRPYLIAGATYTRFSQGQVDLPASAHGGTGLVSSELKADSTWAPSLGVGLEYDYNARIYFEVRVLHTQLSTQAQVTDTGQTFELAFKPMSFTTTVGWRF